MKFFNKLFTLLLFTLCVNTGKSQFDPMYSMYMFDKMLINPAYAGSSSWVVGTLKSRTQNIAIDGQSKTQTFNIHAPIQKKNLGVGLKLIKDQIAIMNTMNIAADLSYHLNLAGGKLSVGFEAGMYSKKINYQDLVVNMRGDNTIPTTAVSSMVPDASAGFYYQKKQFYAGFSNYHLLKKTFDYGTPVPSQSHLNKHSYLIIGNVFDISKNMTFEPSMLLKYQKRAAMQLDLNAMVYYNNRIGAGLQYRVGNAFVTMLRVNITESFRICYSYDMNINKATPYTKGAHEIILSYGIKLPPPPIKKEIHPRYYF